MHSKMSFKQKKTMISSRFMSLDSGEKGQNIEQLDNAHSIMSTWELSIYVNHPLNSTYCNCISNWIIELMLD